MSIWKWADRLLVGDSASHITLGEGRTPLVRSRSIGPKAGMPNLYFKLESNNPSGSYKDRFAAAAVTDLVSRGKRFCLATSSGNTGAALAAYCAAAGIDCAVVIVETAPEGKLSQMLAHGARLYRVRGFGTDPLITEETFACLEQVAREQGSSPMISAFRYSPIGMAGVKTTSYELAEQARARAITLDHVFVPAGGGGLALAVAIGFEEVVARSELPKGPCIECVQPEGNDTIVSPLRHGEPRARAVNSTTLISGLQVASVVDGDEVVAHCRASGGTGHAVSDESIWEMQRRLAREEGVFCEPAGAVAVAGALQAVERGDIGREATSVCLVTGSGFKDPVSVERMNHDRGAVVIESNELEPTLREARTR